MKVFVAMVASVGLVFAAYVIYEISTLQDQCKELSAGVKAATSSTEELAASRQNENESARWDDLSLRLARLEEKLSTPVSEEGTSEEGALATMQSTLLVHSDEIAELRKDLEGARRVRGTLDDTANRVLGAVGQDAGAGGGGLEGLMEMGALFRKSPDELTEEEKARRDEITGQLRQRRDEWAIRSFDRTLEVKLTDQQKVDIQQLLGEETTALDAYRGQELTDEQRTAGRKQVQEQTDQRAAGVLSAEQYESWTSYRTRSTQRRSRFGGFGQRP